MHDARCMTPPPAQGSSPPQHGWEKLQRQTAASEHESHTWNLLASH